MFHADVRLSQSRWRSPNDARQYRGI